MSCKLEAELTAYVDEELDAVQAKTVHAHLTGCADCRATEALLRRTVEVLGTLPAFEPSVELRRTLLSRLDAAPPSLGERLHAWLRPGVLFPSTVGLLAAAAVALYIAGPGAKKNLPPELQDSTALDVAMNFDVASDYDVLGLDSPEDVEVVARLDELEGRP